MSKKERNARVGYKRDFDKKRGRVTLAQRWSKRSVSDQQDQKAINFFRPLCRQEKCAKGNLELQNGDEKKNNLANYKEGRKEKKRKKKGDKKESKRGKKEKNKEI